MDEADTWHGGKPQPRRLVLGGPSSLPQKGQSSSPVLMVEVENFEIGPEAGALPVLANFLALEQQRILCENQK